MKLFGVEILYNNNIYYLLLLFFLYIQDRVNLETGYQEIDCHINGDYSIGCRKEGDEVYIPFSFIHKYFEVSSKSKVNN